MFNLVRNELTKIFSKKGIYIVLIIFLALLSLILGIQKYGENMYVTEAESVNTYLEDEIKTIDTSTEEGKVKYWHLESERQVRELSKQYGGYSTWQGEKILNDVWQIKTDMNLYENGLDEYATNTTYTKDEIQKEYDKIMRQIEAGDWKSFVEDDLKQIDNQISAIEETLKVTTSDEARKELNKNLEMLKIDRECNKWRLEKEIPYRDEKYDSTLTRYSTCGGILIEQNYKHNIDETNYKEKVSDEFNYSAKIEYQNILEEFKIAEYRIKNELPDLSYQSVSGALETLIPDIGLLFIVIISIMITGTIVSDEFNKGTIKLLLIRPYTRRKILLSKIIASAIAIIIAIICIVLIQILVAGIGYGFDTINIPVLKYNFSTNSVMEINVFAWLIINILAVSPIIIILSSIALMIGTVLTNSTSAIALGILTYMGANILRQIAAIATKIKWLKYIPFVNWDLTELLYGRLSQIQGITLQNAILTCLILIVALFVITFENFARKNIKNI